MLSWQTPAALKMVWDCDREPLVDFEGAAGGTNLGKQADRKPRTHVRPLPV